MKGVPSLRERVEGLSPYLPFAKEKRVKRDVSFINQISFHTKKNY